MELLTHVNKITITPVCSTECRAKQTLHLELGIIAQAWDGRGAAARSRGREGRRDFCHPRPAAANREETFGTIDFSTGEAQIRCDHFPPCPSKGCQRFSPAVSPLFKEQGKLHPEMQRNGLGGCFRSYRDTAVMSKPKERERSEALTMTKYKQPGAGKQFTSRSLRGASRTTAQPIARVHLGFAQVKW